MIWRIYLSGEIHTDWREEISAGAAARGLPVEFSAPVTDHAASIGKADIVVVRFGEKYRQWNAAFDAGVASALGKALIVLQPPEHDHALKEVDAAALAVARTPAQVVDLLDYAISGRLPA